MALEVADVVSTKTLSKKERKDKKRKHAEADEPAAPPTDEPKPKKKKSEKKSKPAEEVDPVETPECLSFVSRNTFMLTAHKLSSLHARRRNKNPRKRNRQKMVQFIANISRTLSNINTGVSGQSEKKQKKRKLDADQDATVKTESKKDKKAKRKNISAETVEENPAEPSSSSSSSPTPAEVEAFLAKHSITIHASKSGGTVTPILSFDQLDVAAALKPAFKGFKEPTPVQACSWPPLLQGQDVVGIAETGRSVVQSPSTFFC